MRRALVRVFVFVQLLSLLLEACMDLGKKKMQEPFAKRFTPENLWELSVAVCIRSFVFALCRSELRLSSFW